MINECGITEDAVYYNKHKSDCGAVSHSGDQRDGLKVGYDEVITVDLSKLNYNVSYLVVMINSFKGDPFAKVETADVTVFQGPSTLGTYYLGSGRKGTAAMVGVIYRTNPTWSFVATPKFGDGKVFTECDALIMESLGKAGLDADVLEETKNWVPGSGKKFNMEKDMVVNIPDTLKYFKIGLGWESRLDIDCSVLLMDKHGKLIEKVFYGKPASRKKAVVHSGDCQTGEGEGDDEIIDVYLDRMPEEVDSLWPVISIYTEGSQFDDVKGAYCRIYDAASKAEFARFDLSENRDNISNGNIVANFKKTKSKDGSNGSLWSFQARGYYTQDTSRAVDIEPLCQCVMQNELSGMKIHLSEADRKGTGGHKGIMRILPDNKHGVGGNADCCCMIF